MKVPSKKTDCHAERSEASGLYREGDPSLRSGGQTFRTAHLWGISPKEEK
jgi:hypothetical protein